MESLSQHLNKFLILILISLPAMGGRHTEVQIKNWNHGWTAPYKDEYVSKYTSDPVSYQSYDLNFEIELSTDREITKEQYALMAMIIANIADVHSTRRGMRYDCLVEANPFLPERPNVTEMVLLKGASILPIRHYLWPTKEEKYYYDRFTAGLVAVAAYNNYRLVRKARDNPLCKKLGQ
jgi:hypothetical protein